MEFNYLKIILLCSYILSVRMDDDDILIIGNNYCITNSSSAIIFHKDIWDYANGDKFESSFYPATPGTDLNCDFEGNSNTCQKDQDWQNPEWNRQNSLQTDTPEIITDRRWEAFPIIRTTYSAQKSLQYTQIKTGKNFPISIRIKQEAHIYLCDGQDPPKSNCYWIMLGSNSGKDSIIRKCKRGQISFSPNKYDCQYALTTQKENPLSENEWKHFIIQTYDGTVTVMREDGIFLQSTDSDEPIILRTAFIHSKHGDGLWKIHDYSFLESKESGKLSGLGPNFRITDSEMCISMFIKTSINSKLIVQIKNQYKNKIIEAEFETNGKWKEYKLLTEKFEENVEFTLLLQKKNGDKDENPYWAIDDFRKCREHEFRFINSTNQEIACQQIYLQNSRTITTKTEISTEGINCSVDSFGTACIPCNIFGGTNFCSNFKYCQLDTGFCYCTAGYSTNNCNIECSGGYFGHGCQKQSHCPRPPAFLDGYCTSCIAPFTGYSCDSASQPFFKNAPNITELTPTNFKITQYLQEYEGEGNYYFFEYLKDNETSWKRIEGNVIPLNQVETVTFTAEADVVYQIRAIITTKARDLNYEDNFDRKTVKVFTPCQSLSDDNVIVETRNTSATLTFQVLSRSCKLSNYCFLAGTLKKCNPIYSTQLVFNNLMPFTNYEVTFKHYNGNIFIKRFNTSEGAPSVIMNLKNITSDKMIKLSWMKPRETNGQISSYEIKYRLKKYLACPGSENTEFEIQHTSEREFTLEDLKPYASYEIQIAAQTNSYTGEYVQNDFETFATPELSQTEKILIQSTKSYKTGVVVYLNTLTCQDIQGPIHIQLLLVCVSQWCYGNSEKRDYTYNFNPITIPDILGPYTYYNLTLSNSRSISSWLYGDRTSFQTEPDVPNKVKVFSVYSKDEKSISLRWIPPYPPTGDLMEYYIMYSKEGSYRQYGSFTKELSVSEANCKLWNEFHCAKITEKVSVYYYYDIKVFARNQDPIMRVEIFNTKIYNIKEGPEKPYNLNYKWTDNNELIIYWNHPNITNSRITSFEILSESGRVFYKIESESEYKLVYDYNLQLSKQYDACTQFPVQIKSHNIYYSSGFENIDVSVPPLLPPVISKESVIYNNTNNTITVHVPFQNPVQEIYILISKRGESEDIISYEKDLIEGQSSNLTKSRLVCKATNAKSPLIFEIGNPNITCNETPNPLLESGTNYSINILFVNRCDMKYDTGNSRIRLKRFHKYMITQGDPNLNDEELMGKGQNAGDGEDGIWALLILLAVIPGIIFSVWYAKKKKPDIRKIIPIPLQKEPKTDEVPLTDKPAVTNTRVHAVKPKPAIVLQALKTKHSKRIPIIEFESYVKDSIETGELERQHNLFPKGMLKPHDIGSLPENKNKNRYKNLIAYDHTRVKLKDYVKEDSVGYINANYIDGYRKPHSYIATQGPKTNTLNDFWRMIWQENVKDIVMLANVHENGKKKVEKYWPDINEEKTFGLVKVQYISETVFANFILRVFNVYFGKQERKVNQMHYTTWPDHGVPLYSQSLVPFLQKLLKIPHNTQTPILIHCSAGVGRTGTIILSDICLRMAAGEGFLDFLAHLENLRNQRASLVDNIEQYKLAHLVVLECLFGMRTAIPCTDEMVSIVESTITNNGIKTQMQYILETQWQDMAMETMLENEEVAPIYYEKNRVKDIVPDHYRVYITRYPQDDEKSSYINAVIVDDFSNPGRYIVTQQPLPNTLGDFWRLVVERSCSVIISLNTVNLDDKTVCQIWPEKGEELEPVDFIKVVHKKTQRLNFYKVITLMVEVKHQKLSLLTDGSMEINIIALDNWRPEDLLPNSIEEFLAFRDAADVLSRTSEHVIVTCYDGAKASGLYLALSFLIEKMKIEQECDVCLAVRSIRHSRKQFVTTEEQYEFLYRAAVTFITGFQPYSNFN